MYWQEGAPTLVSSSTKAPAQDQPKMCQSTCSPDCYDPERGLRWDVAGVSLTGRTFAACCPPRSCSGIPLHVASEWSPALAQSGGTAGCGCSALTEQRQQSNGLPLRPAELVLEDLYRRPIHLQGGSVVSPRAWAPPLASTQPRPQAPTRESKSQWQ